MLKSQQRALWMLPLIVLTGGSSGAVEMLLMGDLKETAGLDYDIRFSVGIVLIVIILITNIGLNYIKRRLGDLR
jgi:phosphate transport system permease protein